MPLWAEQRPAQPVAGAISTPRESPQPQIVATLFDDRGTAARALQALIEARLTKDRISVIGNAHRRETNRIGRVRACSRDISPWCRRS